MVDLSIILGGFADAFTLTNLVFVFFGIAVGQFVGALPGTGPVMAMAIAIPFTFTLDPLVAIAFLVAVNKGGLVGGAIPAILINTPGTSDAAATALDGYPLSKKGKPEKATKMALYSSVTGDLFSDIVLSDGNGLEFVEEIISKDKEMKILLSSGYIDEKAELSHVAQKKFKFLEKPYDVLKLLQAVKEALG